MDFRKSGILEIDGERVMFQPTELETRYDEPSKLTGYIINIFQESNARRKTAYGKNPGVKKVIFNDPVTVVIWDDDTKTVVKCQPGDTYDAEKGLALCIAKKYFGNKGNFNEVFKKWIPREDISVEKMRDELVIFCHGKICSECKLDDPCRCRRGTHFKHTNALEKYTMSDDEIREAYKIVFGK